MNKNFYRSVAVVFIKDERPGDNFFNNLKGS